MNPPDFKPPRRTPIRRGHLERLTGDYGRTYGVAPERARRWLSLVAQPEATESELVPVEIGIADFKLDGPEKVACLSLRYQVAQKIHAVTEQAGGRINHRYWDLIDLLLQRELLGGDLIRVREARFEIFTGRDLHPWPPELMVPKEWHGPYAAVAEELEADLPPDVDAAAEAVRNFIAAIDGAGQ